MCPGLPPVPITACNPVNVAATALEDELVALLDVELELDDEVRLELEPEPATELDESIIAVPPPPLHAETDIAVPTQASSMLNLKSFIVDIIFSP